MSISPLPDDILRDVVFLLLSPYSQQDPLRFFRERTALRAVSRQWDAVIISSAQLWTRIHVKLDSPQSTTPLPILQLWLTRSANAPLQLSMEVSTFMSIESDVTTNYFMSLAQTISRWECFGFRVRDRPVGFVARALGQFTFSNAHALRRLSISIPSPYISYSILLNLAQAPAVRSLGWNSAAPGPWAVDRFGLSTMTSLTLLSCDTTHAIPDLLHRADNLVDLRLSMVADNHNRFNEGSSRPRLTFHQLRFLSLKGLPFQFRLIPLLDTPHLEVLCINMTSLLDMRSPLLHLLIPSQHSLCVLSLNVTIRILYRDSMADLLSDPVITGIPNVEIIYPSGEETVVNDMIRMSPDLSQEVRDRVEIRRSTQWPERVLGWTDPVMLAEFEGTPSNELNVFLGDRFDDRADRWRRAVRERAA